MHAIFEFGFVWFISLVKLIKNSKLVQMIEIPFKFHPNNCEISQPYLEVLLQFAQPLFLVLCVHRLVVVQQVVPEACGRVAGPHLVHARVAADCELVYPDKVLPYGGPLPPP